MFKNQRQIIILGIIGIDTFCHNFYAMPPQEFGDKLSILVGEESARGVQGYYEMLASLPVYPTKFNPNLQEVLEKLPVKMTPIEEWVKIHKEFFIN